MNPQQGAPTALGKRAEDSVPPVVLESSRFVGVGSSSDAGARLDDHHAPETNGRMAVCRRCGMRTDVLQGAHVPSEEDVVKANEWLRYQVLEAKVAQFKRVRNT